MSSLSSYVDKNVVIISTDGRTFIGILKGYDNSTNVILASAQERIITPNEETEHIDLGLYFLRGDAIAVCGLVDDETDKEIDWAKVRGKTIGSTRHAT
ncbi:Sm-like ribonucleo protein [Nadsonia fulvescens var. elongata DSM 6958]|uniref:LSM2-LSM8 complex subunit LSM8 n=1 Tax=Nadsonia fulvescens var. elongata DSM 6958 TaxID=857566 RepID=A0A1E3PNZ1_9ASCO|nr:Sm-like ribonucleo protein [Nadsonia fulvescens var. elongata DSM 6958]